MSVNDNIAKAEQDLASINSLRSNNGYKFYLQPRFKMMVESKLQAVLASGIDAEERQIRHRIWTEFRELETLLEDDERNATKIVRRA